MSESGGKIAAMRQQARQIVATASGQAIGQAAREEIQPVIARLDEITLMLANMPSLLETSATHSATSLRQSLAPMTAQVDELRSSIATLPDAMARQIAPIVLMAERLDEVLDLQRKSLAALYEESLTAYRSAMEPVTERLDTGVQALAQIGRRATATLETMRELPEEIRLATAEWKRAKTEAAGELLRRSASKWVSQAMATAALTAVLVLGGAVLGTSGFGGHLLRAGESAKELAWDSLYQAAPPQLQASMRQFLAASSGRK